MIVAAFRQSSPLVLSEGQVRMKLFAGLFVSIKPDVTLVNSAPSSIQDGVAVVPLWQPVHPWRIFATPLSVPGFPVAPKWSAAGTTTLMLRVAVLPGPGGSPLLTKS